jgi:hypothetical protein
VSSSIFEEGLNEDSGDAVFPIVGIEVNDSAIDDPIGDSNRVAECASAKISIELHAFIAVGCQGGGEAAVHESDIGSGLQTFQSKWGFELPESERCFLPVAKVRIRFLNNDVSAPEIRHDSEVDVLVYRALNDRTDSTEYESAGIDLVRANKESAIRLDVAAQSKLKIIVRGTNREAVAARVDCSSGCGLCGCGILIQFPLPSDNADLLIECFQAVAYIRSRTRLASMELIEELAGVCADAGNAVSTNSIASPAR